MAWLALPPLEDEREAGAKKPEAAFSLFLRNNKQVEKEVPVVSEMRGAPFCKVSKVPFYRLASSLFGSSPRGALPMNCRTRTHPHTCNGQIQDDEISVGFPSFPFPLLHVLVHGRLQYRILGLDWIASWRHPRINVGGRGEPLPLVPSRSPSCPGTATAIHIHVPTCIRALGKANQALGTSWFGGWAGRPFARTRRICWRCSLGLADDSSTCARSCSFLARIRGQADQTSNCAQDICPT